VVACLAWRIEDLAAEEKARLEKSGLQVSRHHPKALNTKAGRQAARNTCRP
jgi:hypothetical protein